ncbi:peptidase inhibitor family I36 protein [Streptomyces sp. NPDC004111]|uniref:peptidase inhibitor family I36 protein n=1 Tax=Streptomyces sp. NPDC004111 TaxID=3364690 RepID=UPI0036B27E0B
MKSASTAMVAAPKDCPKGYFCGYKKANFKELGFRYKDCYMQEIPDGMGKGGSWYNNQTKGTPTWFYNKKKEFLSSAGGAPSWDTHGSWAPVWHVWNIC